jgi:hypothetical protein
MAMLELFWEFKQQGDIAEAHSRANASERTALDSQRRIRELQERIDRLTLISAAMWKLLQERVGLSEKTLLDKIEQIDLTDGKLDGRLRKDAVSCPKCNRSIASRHTRCIYCGEERRSLSAFGNVF